MDAQEFEQHRRTLLGVAYRMLGSASEAEDVVQDAWLRWSAADRTGVREPRAFLVRTVTRLCLDVLRSPRVRLVDHVGPLLPEPVPTDRPPFGPVEQVEQRETLSLALLDLLERCTPLERATWVLREAFVLPYDEVAEAVGTTTAGARQLHGRATRRIASGAPARAVRPTDRQRRAVLDAFLHASLTGEVAALAELLVEDAVTVSDGGGRATAARRPVTGRDHVARFLTGLAGKAAGAGLDVLEVNGGPVLVVHRDGAVTHVLEVDPAPDGRVAAVRIVCDPRSLRRLGVTPEAVVPS